MVPCFCTPCTILFLFLGDGFVIDLHFDLLSILYYCYKKNDFSYVDMIQKYYQKNDVHGVVANLYFMSEEEMMAEMKELYEPIDVLKIFRIATNLFSKYFPDLDVVYSIEGCDYVKDILELEELYKLGLRNILLVWNNKNKYGSGNRDDSGLTEEGKKFLRKAIELGISIDLSHMNPKTFSDTVCLLKKEKAARKDVKVVVSHSNCYNLYSHPRNLTDEQLLSLRELNPVVGLVSYGPFVSSSKDLEELKKIYVKHVLHVKDLLGIDAVGVSTDDMKFDSILFGSCEDIQLFSYESIFDEMKKLLSVVLSEDEINKVLYENSYNKLFRREV